MTTRTAPVSKAMKAKDAAINKAKRIALKLALKKQAVITSGVFYRVGESQTAENRVVIHYTVLSWGFRRSPYFSLWRLSLRRNQDKQYIPPSMYIGEYVRVELQLDWEVTKFGRVIDEIEKRLKPKI